MQHGTYPTHPVVVMVAGPPVVVVRPVRLPMRGKRPLSPLRLSSSLGVSWK